jgi:sugar diacid utilization regulator
MIFGGSASTGPIADNIDLPEFLIRRADTAAVRLIPAWARQLGAAGDDQARELRRTLRAFADCSFNVKQTAGRLRVHINTVYFRLNRINTLTGVNPRTYEGTSLLLTALRLLETHPGAQATAAAAWDGKSPPSSRRRRRALRA